MGSKIRLLVPLCLVLALIGWDLWGPHHANLRVFDADAVAHLETRMWRNYYEKHEGALFRDIAALLRTQYHLPWLRSYQVAYEASRAAFVFKRGRIRADYEKALPPLRRYYSAIRQVSEMPFDPERAARLDLEWWIVQRQREMHVPEDLDKALAALQAELYALPAERFASHAHLRAAAMTLRDTHAQAQGVSPEDWQRIEELLRQSWDELARVVRS